jgi:hypothetical protein
MIKLLAVVIFNLLKMKFAMKSIADSELSFPER